MGDITVGTRDGKGTITLRSGDDDFTAAGVDFGTNPADSLSVPAVSKSSNILNVMNDSNILKKFDSDVNLALAKSKVIIDTINAKSLIEQNEILKAQLTNSATTAYVLDTQSILLSEVIGELATLNINITKQIEAIKASAKASAVSVSIDTSKLAIANEKIAEGVENQISTNAKIVEKLDKQIEHYDFSKDGKETLKDSNGNVIKPREIQAQKDAEQFIEKEDLNKTTIEEIMKFNQDVQQFLDSYSPEALFSDSVGTTDGFIEDLNPFDFFDNLLKEDFELTKGGAKPLNP